MEIQALYVRVRFLFQNSVGIWLAVWAVRYKADWDYKLSGTAKSVRWGMVVIGYLLAAALPGPAPMRMVPGLLGICFLCWPNFAYRLTNLFAKWPTTEGWVGSASDDGSQATITYSFELGENIFGGTAKIESARHAYSQGQRVTIAYDPLNPDESKVLPQSPTAS